MICVYGNAAAYCCYCYFLLLLLLPTTTTKFTFSCFKKHFLQRLRVGNFPPPPQLAVLDKRLYSMSLFNSPSPPPPTPPL